MFGFVLPENYEDIPFYVRLEVGSKLPEQGEGRGRRGQRRARGKGRRGGYYGKSKDQYGGRDRDWGYSYNLYDY